MTPDEIKDVLWEGLQHSIFGDKTGNGGYHFADVLIEEWQVGNVAIRDMAGNDITQEGALKNLLRNGGRVKIQAKGTNTWKPLSTFPIGWTVEDVVEAGKQGYDQKNYIPGNHDIDVNIRGKTYKMRYAIKNKKLKTLFVI